MKLRAWTAASVAAIPVVFVLLARFRPTWVIPLNRAVTNRTIGRFANAARIPTFGYVIHVGRKSGRRHRTPVNVFRIPDGFLFGLTYGRDTNWVKNVLAAGGCRLDTGGRMYELGEPSIVHKPARAELPLALWLVLRSMGIEGMTLKISRSDA